MSRRCPICKREKPFSSRYHLQRHIDNAHGELARTFNCELCGESKDNLERLRSHANKYHPGKILTALKQSCFMCSDFFRTVKELNNHLKSEHDYAAKPVRSIKICNICQKTFVSSHKLLEHIKFSKCIKGILAKM
jgi:hypothetical protein